MSLVHLALFIYWGTALFCQIVMNVNDPIPAAQRMDPLSFHDPMTCMYFCLYDASGACWHPVESHNAAHNGQRLLS